MKILQTLIMSLLFCSVNIQAQTSANTANWYETIEFLEEYIPEVLPRWSYLDNCELKKMKENIVIEDNSIIFEINNEYSAKLCKNNQTVKWGGSTKSLNLKRLLSVDINPNHIILTASDSYVKQEFRNREESSNQFKIELNHTVGGLKERTCCGLESSTSNYNSPKIQRLYKAFQHLAFLAGEKRKKSKF